MWRGEKIEDVFMRESEKVTVRRALLLHLEIRLDGGVQVQRLPKKIRAAINEPKNFPRLEPSDITNNFNSDTIESSQIWLETESIARRRSGWNSPPPRR